VSKTIKWQRCRDIALGEGADRKQLFGLVVPKFRKVAVIEEVTPNGKS
jgi:hypothetical protein